VTGESATPSSEVVIEHDGARVPTLVYGIGGSDADGLSGPPRPAIVLSTEAFGINDFTRHVASTLADEGYVVVVPDYYRGHGLADPESYTDFTEVMQFIDELDFVGATHDVMAAIDHARSMPEVDADRVVVWGYCTGSTLAMLAAALDRRLAAAVLFFISQPTFPELTPKRPVQPIDLLWNVACPVLVIYGDEDPIAPPEMIDDLRRRFEQWHIEHQINIYPGAGHAFSAPVPPLRHDAADKASWADAVAFVRERLTESRNG
jgi:carboxymethylenebutenolidase